IYSFTASTSSKLNKWTIFLIPFLTGVTKIHINAIITRTPNLIHVVFFIFSNLINQPFLKYFSLLKAHHNASLLGLFLICKGDPFLFLFLLNIYVYFQLRLHHEDILLLFLYLSLQE